MMYFCFHENSKLPKLAWLIKFSRDNLIIDVYCGVEVEHTENSFVAGVWDGVFSKKDFDKSSSFFGTGAKIENGKLIIVTPSHSLERIVSYENDDYLTFSNSIPFLLSFNHLFLDRKYDQYESTLCSILKGPKKMIQSIPLMKGYFKQYISSIISVKPNLTFDISMRDSNRDFIDYADYYQRLSKMTIALMNNINDSERNKTKYKIVATISKGYDSSACAYFARIIGGDTAVTFCDAQYYDDNGASIARNLGYTNIVERESNCYKIYNNSIDAEYIASGELGTMLQFSTFENDFSNSLVFTGMRGSYWNKEFSMTNEMEMVGYYYYEAGVGMTENALKNNYINIPLPAYCADVCESIKRISNSKEMKPWLMQNDYDKPIPRRILEEAGIDRTAFGQQKRGGGFYLGYDTIKSLKKKMSYDGYESFLQYVKHRKKNYSLVHISHVIGFYLNIIPTIISVLCNKMNIAIKINQRPLKISNPLTGSLLFFWAIEEMCKRYSEALNYKSEN